MWLVRDTNGKAGSCNGDCHKMLRYWWSDPFHNNHGACIGQSIKRNSRRCHHERHKKWMGIEVIHCNISRNVRTSAGLQRTQSKMAMA